MVVVDLLPPSRARHEQREVRRDADEEVQELQRLRIAPLQIIGDEEEWGSRREQRPRRGIEEALSLPGIGP